MEPSREQHSFFALPVWPRYPNKKPPRKRRRSDPEPSPPSTPPPQQDPQPTWTPVNEPFRSSPSEHETSSTDEGSHLPPIARRGGHTKRFAAILRDHNLPPAPGVPYSLRNKHLAVITTILHRSIMENDFSRASRAYGLLIRCKDVDIRSIWGLGVEILLKRGGFQDGEEEEGHQGYRPENLEKAVEFLNRLILFYPYHKRMHTHHPSLLSSSTSKKPRWAIRPSVLEFYPALFGLLIKASERAGKDADPDLHPRRIKEQMESLMLGPPWSDMPGMWLMRGMVCNWIGDLEREGREEMKGEARSCFEQVRDRGGVVPEGVERGEGDDSDDEEEEMQDESDGDEG